MMKIEQHGGPELLKAWHDLSEALTFEIQQDALMAGAEPMRAHAASLAPRSPKRTPHLADEIIIAPARRSLEHEMRGEVVVEMGPAKRPHDHFYGFFQEYGTIRHRAQPFMRPAFDAQASRSLSIVMQMLWQVIQHAAEKNRPSAPLALPMAA
jgi:HK97 gp10 family phage protein